MHHEIWLATMPIVFGLTGLFGGHASHTDRTNQLESWGDLKDIMYNTKATGMGQVKEGASGLSDAANYFHALMSGDQAKISQVLAPQISTIKNQSQQRINTASQFGNRSGGTNASMQAGQEEATKSIQTLFDMLGPEAAKEFAAISGTQESLGTGQEGLSTQAASILGGQAGNTRQFDTTNEIAAGQSAGQAIAALMGLA